MPAGSRLVITVSVILIVVVLLIVVIAMTKIQTNQPNTQVIVNLLNGQQYFGAPHVYQGDNGGTPTSQWPVYYGPNNASQYWGTTSKNQPVLELVPAQYNPTGAMFWTETYSGGSVTITMVSTFSEGFSPPADGLDIYLFLKPTMWSVSPKYNYSISYMSDYILVRTNPSLPPVGGDVILPQSSTSYLIIQWDPWWQFGYTASGATGQWNVWIVSNPSGNNAGFSPSPSPNLGGRYAGWDGIGTGYYQPNPGDLINITVTYDPSTNTLTGIATDLNTGQSASFTLNLGNYYTPPGSGSYVFGIAGSTGGASYANWALLYVATTQ